MDNPVQLNLDLVSLEVGGLQILFDVSFKAYEGEILALIGPNGAGKTSLLNCISGIYHATQGQVLFDGQDISGAKSHQVAGLGIARTFQHVELFEHMTVLQNLLVGRHQKLKKGILSNCFFWGKTRMEEIANRRVVEEIIEFLELEKYRNAEALSLAYGLQKIVGLGRALAMEPCILLMDEPSAGMNRQEKEDLARFILRIKHEMRISIIWVEHDMQLVGDLADRIVVLNFGNKIAEGKAETVLNDQAVIDAYLGAKASDFCVE